MGGTGKVHEALGYFLALGRYPFMQLLQPLCPWRSVTGLGDEHRRQAGCWGVVPKATRGAPCEEGPPWMRGLGVRSVRGAAVINSSGKANLGDYPLG